VQNSNKLVSSSSYFNFEIELKFQNHIVNRNIRLRKRFYSLEMFLRNTINYMTLFFVWTLVKKINLKLSIYHHNTISLPNNGKKNLAVQLAFNLFFLALKYIFFYYFDVLIKKIIILIYFQIKNIFLQSPLINKII